MENSNNTSGIYGGDTSSRYTNDNLFDTGILVSPGRRKSRFLQKSKTLAGNAALYDKYQSPERTQDRTSLITQETPEKSYVRRDVTDAEDSATILAVSQDIVKNYAEAQTKINALDSVTVQADITSQTLRTCYDIVYKTMYADDPDFDREKMEYRINQLDDKVSDSNQDFAKFKGQFIAVHEPVINKDMLTFKVDMI